MNEAYAFLGYELHALLLDCRNTLRMVIDTGGDGSITITRGDTVLVNWNLVGNVPSAETFRSVAVYLRSALNREHGY